MPRKPKVQAVKERVRQAEVGRRTCTMRGRRYVEIDSTEVEGFEKGPPDVIEYIEPGSGATSPRGRRTNIVNGARGGNEPAIRVRSHECEGRHGAFNRWVPIREVLRAWRWRGRFA